MNDLELRTGLPEHLRVLADLYPREGWEGHRNFDEMTRFWLDRHLMFREVMDRLRRDSEGFADGTLDARTYQSRTARMTGFFLNQLHGHHTIEDGHYFPQLIALDARISAGFELLHRDHEMLDAQIQALADATNTLLQAVDGPTGPSEAGYQVDRLNGFQTFLNRHLCDEEDLVVPLILENGPRLNF